MRQVVHGAIWPPNLDQVVPDGLIGVVGAFVIGVVLAKSQRRREDRDAIRAADSNWRSVSPRVLVNARATPIWDMDDLQKLPSNFAELEQILNLYPVATWQRVLGYTELREATYLQLTLARWRLTAREAQVHIARAVLRTSGPDRGTKQRAMTLAVLGSSAENDQLWLGLSAADYENLMLAVARDFESVGPEYLTSVQMTREGLEGDAKLLAAWIEKGAARPLPAFPGWTQRFLRRMHRRSRWDAVADQERADSN